MGKNTKLKRVREETGLKYAQIHSILKIIRKELKNIKTGKIGGNTDCYVEIDEMAVTKRKFNRGRRAGALWCVGGVCREHKKTFFEPTYTRNKATLLSIIDKNVKEIQRWLRTSGGDILAWKK